MIYRLDFDLDKYSALFIDPDEMDDLYYPEGEPLSDDWSALKGELVDGKNLGRELEHPDICTWEGSLVLGPKAYELLGDKLLPFSELLPVYVNTDLWYIVNILVASDAVDHSKSEQDLRGGIYVGLKSLQFNEDRLINTLLFKTDFDEKVGNFCNESFREEVEDTCRLWNKMRGVVELFPRISSPNRTCAFQRIRLSTQQWLVAIATCIAFL